MWNSKRFGVALGLSLCAVSASEGATPPMRSPENWASRAFEGAAATPKSGGLVSAADLIGLRDLGPMSVSPDGRWLAFSLRQPSLTANDYVVRWFVVPTDGSTAPRALAVDGGSPIRYRGEVGVPMASYDTVRPRWSPDSLRFAFRRQEADQIELWSADVATLKARREDAGRAQVDRFDWSPAGALVYRTGLDAEAFQRTVESEAAHGWLLDRRMTLFAARTPSPLPPLCSATPAEPGCDVRTLAAMDGRVRSASAEEIALLTGNGAPLAAAGGVSTRSPEGRWVFTAALDRGWKGVRRVSLDGGQACNEAICSGQFIEQLGWSGLEVWFVQRASHLDRTDVGPRGMRGPIDETVVAVWSPQSGSARVVARSGPRLRGCEAAGRRLVCIRSAAAEPPHLVTIDLGSGRQRLLADPNPWFRTRQIPTIRTLPLVDAEGNRGFAKLVYPKGYVAGRRYPMVVTTYRANEFLRGGVGDEYPIFPLAAEGFFVLAVDSPEDLKGFRTLDFETSNRADRTGQRALSRFVQGLEAAVDSLVGEGLVDRARVGITGLSYGAMTVHYALQNSDRFAVGIASSGSADASYFALFPPGGQREVELAISRAGSVLPLTSASYNLSRAWSQQPERLKAPLLINAADGEAMKGFEGYAALQEARRPLEVRIFPDEGHVKYHPGTFAGVYANNIMWLNFWLRDVVDPDPQFAAQYERWIALRSELRGGTSQPSASP